MQRTKCYGTGEMWRTERMALIFSYIPSAYLFSTCSMSDTVLGLGNTDHTETQPFWVYIYWGHAANTVRCVCCCLVLRLPRYRVYPLSPLDSFSLFHSVTCTYLYYSSQQLRDLIREWENPSFIQSDHFRKLVGVIFTMGIIIIIPTSFHKD